MRENAQSRVVYRISMNAERTAFESCCNRTKLYCTFGRRFYFLMSHSIRIVLRLRVWLQRCREQQKCQYLYLVLSHLVSRKFYRNFFIFLILIICTVCKIQVGQLPVEMGPRKRNRKYQLLHSKCTEA